MQSLHNAILDVHTGDKNSCCPLIITSEIQKGGVILPKALLLQGECFGKNPSHIAYYSLMLFVAYAFKSQVHVFEGRLKILSHSSCRTRVILKYFCPLHGIGMDPVISESSYKGSTYLKIWSFSFHSFEKLHG